MRWNLLAFGAGLLVALVVVIVFGGMVISSLNLDEQVEMVVVAVFTLIGTVAGGFVGYAMGVMQALTAPPEDKPEAHIPVSAALKLAGKE